MISSDIDPSRLTAAASSDRSGVALDTLDVAVLHLGPHRFGAPLSAVEDVFTLQSITPVPTASPLIAGIVNLRGRIVTALDLRAFLDPSAPGDAPQQSRAFNMAVGVTHEGDAYGLLIDGVSDVMSLNPGTLEACPANLPQRWREVLSGVHRLESCLLFVLDVELLLATFMHSAAVIAPSHGPNGELPDEELLDR